MKLWPVVTGVAIALTLVACKSPTPPKGVQPISGFDASRYLGKWYEVARLENRFERGLEQVTATYGTRSDGGISVVNRGYDPVKKRWNESDGKAYFTGAPTTAALKVSFFGPLYGGYNVIRLDDDYQYALVSGPNRDYLWILSRTPTIPAAVKQDYLNTARELGFDVDRLVWIRQTPR
ncbi:TPA: lipocalin family protein [Klebsiella variicola]|uniref:lipocalin family protein n=1 Tax=Klebsiella variicola TaxID=244366 RepID=UPI0010F041A4|nr:outer membrane lipoprotein blc [Klebsiella variicola]HCC2288138.1 lipocalin family protein [Klebsiella variicola]HDK6003708.1 lipocalin family protein [Klebsiella variicola]HDK6843154.1 lipocalin family protein [Klebsiella variicola]